ncbi:hypothetical protein [Melittangium boletus]|uniref:Amidase n=1 Tax=Melittangium boletus DSM 14713 TaxID=1294270 RepID=A0A250IHC7_9BACT|nr:hypothetical protein [Melittangium boletus]ATB30678.1 amidase [Melittangium boletus DSM 14713]
MRRAVKKGLLAGVALLLVGGGTWYVANREHVSAFQGVLSAYTAKEYCSCRFVMGFSEKYCLGYARQYIPYSSLQEETDARRVTVRGLGLSSTATWVSPREGCHLIPATTP